MTNSEKYNWASLVTTGLIFYWFQSKMLDGWSLVDMSPQGLMKLYTATVIAFIVVEIVVAIFTTDHKAGKMVKDERDHMIAAKASGIANWVVVIGVNIMLFTAVYHDAFEDYQGPDFHLTSLESLVFHLFGIMIVATIVERIVALVYYRAT